MFLQPRFHRELSLRSLFLPVLSKKQFNTGVLLFRSCAEALTFALEQFPLKLKVGIPIYCCASVARAVKTSGHEIVYLDIAIDSAGYKYELSIFKDVHVLLIVHYFGFYFDYIEIKKKYPNIMIIEDCSHVDFRKCKGVKESLFQIYSFNLHKPLHAGLGGALITNDSLVHHKYMMLPLVSQYTVYYIYIKQYIKDYAYWSIIYNLVKKFVDKNRQHQRYHVDTSKLDIFRVGDEIFRLINRYHNVSCVLMNYMTIPCDYRLNVFETDDLCYFPIFCRSQKQRRIVCSEFGKSVDMYILWENAFINGEAFQRIDLSQFELTKRMLERIIFFPMSFFSNKQSVNRLTNVLLNS